MPSVEPKKFDYYTPAKLENSPIFNRDEIEQRQLRLREKFEELLSNRKILEPQFSPRELLEAYRQGLLDRLNGLDLNKEKIADLLATFYDILEPAIAFPVIQQKLAQMGDGVIDLIAAEDVGNRLLDALETDYFVWFSLNEPEAIAEAVKVQEENGKATSASSRSLSEKKIEAALIRLKSEEYQVLHERLSFVKRSVETLKELRKLINDMNFNMQRLGDWTARTLNGK